MSLKRNKLYVFLLIACLLGYVWLAISALIIKSGSYAHGVCIFKNITNIPCPSCGTTRSVILLLQGDIINSLLYNPFGIIVSTIMLVTPFWLGIDLLTKGDSLFSFYNRIESIPKKPGIAVLLIVLVLINWIWNITKGI